MDNSSVKHVIVVLGMHRSGTSAITRGLEVLGVRLGDRLFPPGPDNVKGYWEDLDLVELNMALLARLGHDWHTLAPVDADRLTSPQVADLQRQAVEILGGKLVHGGHFGIKDPRTARLLPFWNQVFDQLGATASYVIACRNPMSVVRSLAARNGFDHEKSYFLWQEHMLGSLLHSRGARRLVVDFDRLLEDPEHQLRRMARGLDLSFDPAGAAFAEYRGEFLEESLRHARFQLEDLPLEQAAPPEATELFRLLSELADDSAGLEDAAVVRRIESLRQTFLDQRTALTYMGRCEDRTAAGMELLKERDETIQLQQADLEGHRQVLAAREAELAVQRQQFAAREADLATQRQLLAAREAELEQQRRARAAVEEQVTAAWLETESLRETVQARDQQVADLNATIDALRASTSWRVTAPLRSISLAISRGLAAPPMRRLTGTVRQKLRAARHLMAATRWAAGRRPLLRTAVQVLTREGVAGLRLRVAIALARTANPDTPAGAPAQAQRPGLFVVPHYVDPALDQAAGHLESPPSVAVHLHLYYTEMLDELVARLAAAPCPFDLFVSVPEQAPRDTLEAALRQGLPQARRIWVEAVPNRGRDLGPLIVQFGPRLAGYDIVGHFHTKRSPHNQRLSSWCGDILDTLLGPRGNHGGRLAHIFELLRERAKIVYPEGTTHYIKDHTGWSDNFDIARRLLDKYSKLSIEDFPTVEFPEGAMFWARGKALGEFLRLPLRFDDFPAEPIPEDGTLAHALERLLLVFASASEGDCVRLHRADSIHDYRHFEEQEDFSAAAAGSDIKVLSYYLPQFHPIPENDRWHGAGFTEWTKVRAANPLFQDHYQQHIPHPDLGYYLLDSPATLRKQAEMMRKAGVHGQVFYHYWFTGKLILEGPARMLLATPDVDMPFCFCWANENWTRRWDGNESEILLKQDYSDADARAFVQYLIPFFQDPRYIRVDNRPVLFVYRPSSIPDPRQYQDIWAEECARAGLERPYVVAVLTRGASDPREFGMDAAVERVLHDWTGGAVADIKAELTPYLPLNGSVLPYDQVADYYRGQTDAKDFTYFRSLVPIWDNTARYGSEAFLLHGSTPAKFQQWLESAAAYSRRHLPADRRFVVINAWNEWAEGAHLEPDTRYGYSYLNAVGRTLAALPYRACLNREAPVAAGMRLHLSFARFCREQMRLDPDLRRRFLHQLVGAHGLDGCVLTTDAEELLEDLPGVEAGGADGADQVLLFRWICFFGSDAIARMLRTAAYARSSIVVPNGYGAAPLVEVTDNGSLPLSGACSAPMSLLPRLGGTHGYRNVRMRTDVHVFSNYRRHPGREAAPAVTTIIRFHQQGEVAELRRALLCLAAMHDCRVEPLIAAQDLDPAKGAAVARLLEEIPWAAGVEPRIQHFRSASGSGDLRTRMLNESLRQVRTRYAGFLDYDDLLMPHAYGWLLNRLRITGKAVAFGRVYATRYDQASGLLLHRSRTYEYGYSYDDFVRLNHAPLHSFLLDLDQLDLSLVTYHDDQRYMEDYYLTLQLFTRDNVDWASLSQNMYIGDYIHSLDRDHTLAVSDSDKREALLADAEYLECEQRIHDLRMSLLGRTAQSSQRQAG